MKISARLKISLVRKTITGNPIFINPLGNKPTIFVSYKNSDLPNITFTSMDLRILS